MVNVTNVISHLCKHGGAQAFYNTNTTQEWAPPLTANLIGLILRHNVGVIIFDTDTLWTQTARL